MSMGKSKFCEALLQRHQILFVFFDRVSAEDDFRHKIISHLPC